MLSRVKTGDEDSNYNHAKKWCTTYKTVKEKITDSKKNPEDKTDDKWKGKYDTAIGDSGGSSFKETIKKFKEKHSPGSSDEDTKKREAIYKWCNMALDASTDAIKTQVTTHCELK